MKKKKNLSDKIALGLLIVGAGVMLLPFLYTVMTCFKSLQEVSGGVVTLFPKSNELKENLKAVLTNQDYNFLRFFLNTLFVIVIRTAGIVITSGLAGYAFAKFDCILSKVLFAMLMAVLFIPSELLGIPFYEAMVNLNLRYSDIYVPFWIAAWFGIDVTTIFLFRQFFITIPNSLVEAAKLDGASEQKAFFKIVMPLAKPVIATVIILNFVGTYNDVYNPSLYVRADDTKRYLVSQSISIFENMFNTGSGRDYLIPYNYMAVATIIAIIPVLIFFFSAQKKFIEGLAGTGMKG